MIPNDTKWCQVVPVIESRWINSKIEIGIHYETTLIQSTNLRRLRSNSFSPPSTNGQRWRKDRRLFLFLFVLFGWLSLIFGLFVFFLVPLSRHSQWSPSPKRPRPTNRWGDPTSRPSSASLLKYFSLSLFLSLWWACFITSLSVSQTLKKKIGPGTRLGWQKPTVHLVLALVFFFNGNPEPRRSSFHCELQLTLIGLLAFHSFALLLFFES